MSEQTARMSSDERREQVLDAALVVFGEKGYAGGTTDEIARRAGISQAYVVRMFGSKEALYVEVSRRATELVAAAFRGALATLAPDAPAEVRERELGKAYADLIADRNVLLTLQHLFSQGHDPVLGPVARECFLSVYDVVRTEAGLTAQEASGFFARGMLINVLMSLQLPQHAAADSKAAELVECTFPGTP